MLIAIPSPSEAAPARAFAGTAVWAWAAAAAASAAASAAAAASLGEGRMARPIARLGAAHRARFVAAAANRLDPRSALPLARRRVTERRRYLIRNQVRKGTAGSNPALSPVPAGGARTNGHERQRALRLSLRRRHGPLAMAIAPRGPVSEAPRGRLVTRGLPSGRAGPRLETGRSAATRQAVLLGRRFRER